jgi:dTDP-4-dehydrorhamnose reductase
MKILLLGMNGQLGWELQRALAPLGNLHCLDRTDADLFDATGLRDTVASLRPDIIFNAAAYTAVDKAEDEPEAAFAVNADAPTALSQSAKQAGALLVHYSTDYVFSGAGHSPWTEESLAAPRNIYGRSKLEGERAIQESGCRHLIFRTSWVYASRSKNFLKTILNLAESSEELKIIGDQVGAPTGAEFLADASTAAAWMALRQPELSGLYHLTASGETSWHGYAKFIIERATALGKHLLVKSLLDIPTSAYAQKASRPLNSRLATAKFKRSFGLVLPPWEKGVERALVELIERSR